MKLEAATYLIRFVFNPQGQEFANLGLIIVCDAVNRVDLIASSNPEAKSRADYPIDAASAQAFLRRCGEALRELADKRKAAAAEWPGLPPPKYSFLCAGMEQALLDPPFVVALGPAIGIEVADLKDGATEKEAADHLSAAHQNLAGSAVEMFLKPKILRPKTGGLIIPGADRFAALAQGFGRGPGRKDS